MELVLPMYNAHPYFSLKNMGTKGCITLSKYSKTWFSEATLQPGKKQRRPHN